VSDRHGYPLVIGKDLQNFMIESTNRERDKKSKYKKKGCESTSPLNCSKLGLEDAGLDNVGIAHEIRLQTMGNGPPLLFPTRF